MPWLLLPPECPDHPLPVFRLTIGIRRHLEFSTPSSLAAESTHLRLLLSELPTAGFKSEFGSGLLGLFVGPSSLVDHPYFV